MEKQRTASVAKAAPRSGTTTLGEHVEKPGAKPRNSDRAAHNDIERKYRTNLKDRIADLQTNLAAVTTQNDRLVATLKEAREQIVTLKQEVDRLAQPPA